MKNDIAIESIEYFLKFVKLAANKEKDKDMKKIVEGLIGITHLREDELITLANYFLKNSNARTR